MGITAAVASKRLIPLDKISLSKDEKDLAALEVVKLHQLVITENKNKNFLMNINPSDSKEEETIEGVNDAGSLEGSNEKDVAEDQLIEEIIKG